MEIYGKIKMYIQMKEVKLMNHSFCKGCTPGSDLPECAIGLAPGNAYMEDIINGSKLSRMEHFICHKTAQDFSESKLSISNKCDDCGLCFITCPYTSGDYTTFFTSRLEQVIFNDFGKTSILFQALFPDTTVAAEVQVKGNFRTKRIDLVLKKNTKIYLIKMLKTTTKVPFYTRSYNEVIEQYHDLFPNLNFTNICLVPTAKTNDSIPVEANILNISALYELIRG